MEPSNTFTEEDQKNLVKLPPEQVGKFMERLSDIQMRTMIADGNWETTIDKIHDDTRALIKDVKEALAKN